MLNKDGKPDNVVALAAYEAMAEKKGVVVRFRGKEYGCESCLRITVGTEEEVTRFLKELKDVLGKLHANTPIVSSKEEQKELEAS